MARRYSNRYNYGGFAPYVPVAVRRAKAKKQIDKLVKKGEKINPIEIEGRTIARSFWGKGWCKHLESFGDYSNRLPRGRTYVRNGSVCHLDISKGKVTAMVAGSSMYHVSVSVKPLSQTKWSSLKKNCTGKIGSLLELLQGKLSDEIMSIVTDKNNGLFPLLGEISYNCNCPDSASMCKHISAVMYGIGARLDQQPELLFLLRGVDRNELITAGITDDTIIGKGSRRSRRRSIAGSDLENVFGVELEQRDTPPTLRKRTTAKRKNKKTETAHIKTPAQKRNKQFTPTGRKIKHLRKKMNMNLGDFAKAVGVSASTISKWEKTNGQVRPQAKGLHGLTELYNKE